MSWTAMTDVPNPIIVDAAGTAGSGYVLKAYLPGTTTTTSIAIDSSGSSPQSTITANADGKWEVSGNEIIPFIDRAHKWGIFASAAHATANTPFYMGPFDNVPQGSDATSTKDASTITYTPAGTGAVATTVQAFFRSIFLPCNMFGTTGDGTTDDLAALNLGKTACATLKKAYYIPRPATYYKLSDVFTISAENFSMFGDGTLSCFVSHNVAGADVISITARSCRIRDIGVSGLTGGGHGVHINSGAIGDHNISDVWIGWVDGDGLRVTTGQSSTFTNVKVDQNSGYRPITLTSGTEGNTNNGFNVLYNASGNTNNQTFVNCIANGGAGNGYSLKIGDGTAGGPESCYWNGGLLQGSVNFTEVFISGKDCHVSAHIEPPVGATANYVATFSAAVHCSIYNSTVQGDVLITNGSVNSGLRNVRGAGLNYTGSTGGYWIKGQSRNITTGPASGYIKDNVGDLEIQGVTSSSSAVFHQGNPFNTPQRPFFSTNFADWYDSDGAGTLRPFGFGVGAAAVTRNAVTYVDVPYSCQVIPASNYGTGITYSLPSYAVNRKVYVSAWVYNSTTAGSGTIIGTTSTITGTTAAQVSFQQSKWELMQFAFIVDGGTSPTLNFTGLSGDTILWDRISITIEDAITEPKRGYTDVTMAASTSGTITISSTYDRIFWEKNGPLVTFRGFLAVTSVSAPVGTFKIQGLPYASSNLFTSQRPWQLIDVNINSLGLGAVVGRMLPNSTEIEVYKYTAGNWADCAGDITSSADIYVSGSYLTDS
jgi:hypothetical protein